jgi:asparagine synthase (glutamine-hydrolysing)
MCGIAGFSGDFDAPLLERMSDAIAHRGPDNAGTLHLPDQRVGLTHRRLSIIDLSAAGNQPMGDPDGKVSIVYNGEIYNFRELRDDLVASGVRFRSQCDTEVLIQLYLRDGEKMLPRLNGIFAFALWDSRDRSLFIARDQLGIKPLYYAEPPGGFLFASEMKALLHEPSLDRTLNPLAVHYHLTYLWAPAPHTMLKSVKKLEPGHAMWVEQGRIRRVWRYYDLPYDRPPETISVDDAVEGTRAHVKQAVERQMVADVQVGAFLSGGLDSSAVAAGPGADQRALHQPAGERARNQGAVVGRGR